MVGAQWGKRRDSLAGLISVASVGLSGCRVCARSLSPLASLCLPVSLSWPDSLLPFLSTLPTCPTSSAAPR